MDPATLHNLAVSIVLLVSMTATALLFGWVVVGVEAACVLAWRAYSGRRVR
jgi:hypothetical protein